MAENQTIVTVKIDEAVDLSSVIEATYKLGYEDGYDDGCMDMIDDEDEEAK